MCRLTEKYLKIATMRRGESKEIGAQTWLRYEFTEENDVNTFMKTDFFIKIQIAVPQDVGH